MGSGKSSLVITLLLGAMLDPLVDIDVVVMAENADYDPMRPRLRTLVTGVGDDTVDACLAHAARALRGRDHRPWTGVARARRPRGHPHARGEGRPAASTDHGRWTSARTCSSASTARPPIEVTSKLMSTARKYAITLVFLTPEPSKDALPRKLISIASNKACFAIGDQLGNDAVLGTGSYKAGISAVGLTPKTDDGPGDVGTCMQRGFTAAPGLLRSYFVGQDRRAPDHPTSPATPRAARHHRRPGQRPRPEAGAGPADRHRPRAR